MRVLVAEDDRVSLRILEVTLTKWGYEVVPCEDGAQAWETLQRGDPPGLALLDWMMPGMDGVDLCTRMRQSPSLSSVYTILLTARGRREDMVEGLDAGADDYVKKPFDREELRARLRVGERVVELQNDRLRRETVRYVDQLEHTVAELQDSRSRIVEVHEAARKAIAGELHGRVQTQLLMLTMRLDEIREKIPTLPSDAQVDLVQAAADLEGIRENEIRQISHRLHPSIVGVGLRASLRSLSDQFDRSFPVELEVAPEIVEREFAGGSSIPFNVRLGMYRVAEEALANALKHANATTCTVSLWLNGATGELCLSVKDDGKGFVADEARRGLGTVTMEDYMGAMRGSIKLGSAPGQGTIVTAAVPLDERGPPSGAVVATAGRASIAAAARTKG